MNVPGLVGGRYEVGDPIGEGAMGTVHRGLDRSTGEVVALKFLRRELVSGRPSLVERFVREAEVLRRLDHPNVVKVFDLLEAEGGHVLVLEFVSGGSLRDLLEREGTLAPAHTLNIALDLADALTRTHRLQVVHRDLKPENVLMTAAGTARLTDFGVAHLSQRTHNLTAPGSVVGTCAYLSPEACHGSAATPLVDVWAFGALLFEMLAGEPPFMRDTVPATLMAITTEAVPDLLALRPEVPEALADLIYRMLDKNPATRIASARAIGAELERIAATAPTGLALSATSTQLGAPLADLFTGRSPARSDTPQARYALPVATTPFVGRQDALRDVLARLAEPDCRLLTLLGTGGIGKSRLALEVATRLAPGFADGACVVSLAGLSDAAPVGAAVAASLAVPVVGDVSLDGQLASWLRGRTLLLVLDNLEHLLDASPLLARLLAEAPGLKLLATSRVRLGLRAEHVFELGAMPVPDEQHADRSATSFESCDAVQLFLAHARRAQPGFEVDADERAQVARICRLVGGIPLGIELAAAWVRLLPPDEIVAELEGALDFLETDARDVPERHRSLRTAFEYSWRLLAPPLQEAFAQLSTLRGGFDREAAREVAGASLRTLMQLVDQSLVLRDRQGRFTMLEPLRQFAAERLAAEPQRERDARDRHARWFGTRLAAWQRIWTGLERGTDTEVIAAMELERDNVQAAWAWATEHAVLEVLGSGLLVLTSHGNLRGRAREVAALLREAIARVEALPPTEARRLTLGRLHTFAARAAEHLHGLTEATAHAEAALRLLVHPDDAVERAVAQSYLAAILSTDVAQHDRARALAEEALAVHRRERFPYGIAITSSFLGNLTDRAGDPERACAMIAEAIEISVAIGSAHGTGRSHIHLSQVLARLGRVDEALTGLRSAITLAGSIGDLMTRTYAQLCGGWILARAGRSREALELAGPALVNTRRNGPAEFVPLCVSVVSYALAADPVHAPIAARIEGWLESRSLGIAERWRSELTRAVAAVLDPAEHEREREAGRRADDSLIDEVSALLG